MPTSLVVSYTLDHANRIVGIGGSWNCFALENGALNLLESQVLGRDIGEFIIGDTTRMFVFAMLDSARLLAKPITRSYRCDSPQYRRFMEMTLLPGPQDMIELHHRLVREEPVQYPIKFTVAPDGAHSGLVKRCSMCNRLNLQNRWLEADEAAHQGLLTQTATHLVIYGVCESCRRRLPKHPP